MSTSSSERPVVYVDESANSGQNLLDPHQPVFTVAGVHLPDDLAASIVDEVRGQLPRNLREPKYTSLAGSSRGRKSLMNAFLRLPEGSVRTYLVHKRFMVMTKIVDVIVEPMAHRDGYNLYEGKETLALADMMHLGGPVLGDADAYDRMLHAFVNWVRQKATTDELYAAVTALKSSVQNEQFAEWVEVLEYCRPAADETAAEIASQGHRDELDPAIPSLYCLATTFGQTLAGSAWCTTPRKSSTATPPACIPCTSSRSRTAGRVHEPPHGRHRVRGQQGPPAAPGGGLGRWRDAPVGAADGRWRRGPVLA